MRWLKIILPVLLLSIAGCAAGGFKKTDNAPAKMSFDFSSTPNKARLNVVIKLPPQEVMTESYKINIDNLEPFLLPKNSQAEITLDAGHHVLQINPLKDKTPGEFQGKPVTKEFFLDRHKIVTLEYSPPLWVNAAGRIVER